MKTMVINTLPTKDLRLKRPIEVEVTKKDSMYFVNLNSIGLILEASAETPKKARNELARGLVKQYNLLKILNHKPPLYKIHRIAFETCQVYIEEVSTSA